MNPSFKIKDFELKLIEDKKYCLKFFSKTPDTISVDLDEADCYWLYREIKRKLKLK